ncbi:MAG: hypothetical protein ACYTFK_14300 [Planctomycetota bacterium]|jgi:hypothetical protein
MAKKTATQKQAKSRAKKVAKGKRYIAKGTKVGRKSVANQTSPKRRKQVKGQAQAGTAENLIKAGKAIVKSGGQGTLKKKRNLKVTKKSMHEQATAGDKYYTGKKKDYKGK